MKKLTLEIHLEMQFWRCTMEYDYWQENRDLRAMKIYHDCIEGKFVPCTDEKKEAEHKQNYFQKMQSKYVLKKNLKNQVDAEVAEHDFKKSVKTYRNCMDFGLF